MFHRVVTQIFDEQCTGLPFIHIFPNACNLLSFLTIVILTGVIAVSLWFDLYFLNIWWGLPWWLSGKESTCQCRRCEFNSWGMKIPSKRKWQPTPAFLPGKSHGQRSLTGYSSWGHKRIRHAWVTKQQQITNEHFLGTCWPFGFLLLKKNMCIQFLCPFLNCIF